MKPTELKVFLNNEPLPYITSLVINIGACDNEIKVMVTQAVFNPGSIGELKTEYYLKDWQGNKVYLANGITKNFDIQKQYQGNEF
jgi:hypothetical protein